MKDFIAIKMAIQKEAGKRSNSHQTVIVSLALAHL